jgi:trans-aconitate 2-methyltransferase
MNDPAANVDWNASVYHRVAEPQLAWGLRVLERAALRGDETVLDAGCGSGRLTGEILEKLPRGRLIAVDVSEAMLEKAREHLAPRHGDRVRFVRSDLTELSLDEPVDVVFSAATFHWVPDAPRLYASLLSALRPGGRLVAQCGGGKNLARVYQRHHAVMQEPRFSPYFQGFRDPTRFDDAETTARLLTDAGFTDVHTSLEPAPTPFPDRAGFVAFCRAVILRHHLSRLPDEALREAFVDAMADRFAGDDPPFVLDYVRLNLTARRPATER